MGIEAHTRVTKRRGRAPWRAVTFVLLVAFTLQSFVTETHLHAVPAAHGTQSALQAPHPGNTPLDESVAACPFCQATIHAGAFFAPAAPVLVRPVSWTGFAPFSPLPVIAGRASAHAWYSRAPPPSRI